MHVTKLSSGAVYEGEFFDGHFEGHGKLTFPDGEEYEGTFKRSAITGELNTNIRPCPSLSPYLTRSLGQGMYRWPNGAVYQGEMLNGLRHGQGRMSFSEIPSVYEGAWIEGKRHGYGTLSLNESGTHRYQGEFHSDMKQGKGTMTYSNGDVFEGDWAADQKEGQGKMSWISLKQEYEGTWSKNKPNGYGLFTWFQQVSEPTAGNHALIIRYNRYKGRFVDGQRSGYGAMYYATGSRYEGEWLRDQKQGEGCFVFEGGDVWRGSFEEDRPVLEEGQQFAPSNSGLFIYVSDLVEREENPAASARGVKNVLMVNNTDLRALYDKYCRRPSLHLDEGGGAGGGHVLLTGHFWELVADARMVSSSLPTHKAAELLVKARRPPDVLEGFRSEIKGRYQGSETTEDSIAFWSSLDYEAADPGPIAEVLFPSFCEALVRIADARYKSLPALERRLHSLINLHLLGLAAPKGKTPPRTALHRELWGSEHSLHTLHLAIPALRALFAATAGAELSDPGPVTVYSLRSSVRKVVATITKQLSIVEGLEPMQAAKAFCLEFLHFNTFNGILAKTAGGEGGDTSNGDQDGVIAEAVLDKGWEREVMAWMDMPVSFPEFVLGVTQVAHQSLWLGEGDLSARLQILMEKIQVAAGMATPKEETASQENEQPVAENWNEVELQE